MTLVRPTLQGRNGYNPNGYGPGVNAPYGYSSAYFNGTRMHNGQDYFWLGAESAARLGISTEASKGVYAVVDGPVYRVDDSALGLGLYQQIDTAHRAYYWHLSERVSNGTYKTTDRIGRMGLTGTAAGTGEHVHFEVREAPYGSANRKDPEPFFSSVVPATGGGSIPITNVPPTSTTGEDMNLMRTTDGKVWLVTPNGMAHVTDPKHLVLIQRVLKSAPGVYDNFYEAERRIVLGYIHAAGTVDDSETTKIIAALAAVKPVVDIEAVVNAVKSAIAATGVRVDADKIAIAVETRLKDEFDAIPAQVNADAARRLAQ